MNYQEIRAVLSEESSWTESNEAAILEPFEYIISNRGKDIRRKLIKAFNTWLNVPEEQLSIIAKVVDMLHNASLMIDDIEDDSQLRRGHPVAHKIYGVAQTINSANYAYFLAYQELFALRTSALDLESIVTTEILSLHRGQGKDILWRDSLSCPTEEEYIAMVNQKTGSLLRIGIKLMMACATTNRDVDYVPVVNLIGVYAQIRDDYMNLQSAEYSANKGFAEDLTEGKFSFPVIHSIQADRANRQVLNVLQKRPSSPTLKAFTIEYMQNHTRSFEYTVSVLTRIEQQVRDEITRLGGNKGLEVMLDYLHVQIESDYISLQSSTMKTAEDYVFFWKTNEVHGWASQWYYSPFIATVDFGGETETITFLTTEHWMMVQKSLLFKDYEIARAILAVEEVTSGAMATVKALGRKAKNFDEGVWVRERERIVVEGNKHKFSQNQELREKLVGTGTKEIVEASPRDRIWGIGFGEKNALKNKERWGLNLLGRALVQVRSELDKVSYTIS